MPKVSVIIPVYNVEEYLPKCLDSITNQTLRDIEIICIDDCSTDSSCKIIKEYAGRDNRIKLIENQQNSGAAISRNNGFEIAAGEYIYFMDSDDWIDNDYLKTMVKTIEEVNTDVVVNLSISYHKMASMQVQYLRAEYNLGYITNKQEILQLPVMAWCKLFKYEFLEKNSLKFLDIKYANDLVFHYETLPFLEKVFTFKGPYYHYIYRKQGLSNQNPNIRYINAFDLIFSFYEKHNLLQQINFKLFSIPATFSIENKQQYEVCKNYFKKIAIYINNNHIELYNDFDLYVYNAIMQTNCYEEFSRKYNKNIFFSYKRNQIKQKNTTRDLIYDT